MSEFIYQTQSDEDQQESKVFIKFYSNIYLDESFLKKHNIEYTEADLVDTPLGKRFVIKDANGKGLPHRFMMIKT